MSVSGASEVTIITSMGTDYKNEYPKYRTGESKEALENRVKWYVEQAEAKGYDKLKADHISDYQKIFNRGSGSWTRCVLKDNRYTAVSV